MAQLQFGNTYNKCVYLHRYPKSNIPFYVGIGNEDRPFDKSGRNKFWNRIVKKHNYIIDICETSITWEEACDKEVNLIKLIGRRDLGQGTLVNYTDGGEGCVNLSEEIKYKCGNGNRGRKFSDEVRLSMSNGQQGRTIPEEIRLKISNSHLGIKPSKETREKQRNAKLGKRLSQETKDKVKNNHGRKIQLLNIETGIYYDSILEACKLLGYDHGNLCRMISGKLKNKTNLIKV